MSVPKRFLPLSQFFLQQTDPEKGDKVLYGFSRPEKKKKGKDQEKDEKGQETPKEPKEEPKKKKEEGITTTANVPTVPVPIGAGDGRKFLDRSNDKKKKKKKMSQKMTLLLRHLF